MPEKLSAEDLQPVKYARWIGLAALVMLALPAVLLTCYMLGQFGPQMSVRLWVYVIYNFLFGVLS